jgi:anti-sigma28 factor (negative regulator of flagellin synthesis)
MKFDTPPPVMTAAQIKAETASLTAELEMREESLAIPATDDQRARNEKRIAEIKAAIEKLNTPTP